MGFLDKAKQQATQLARIGVDPVVATDADIAGRIAAERAFWMLSCYRLDPLYARLPDGTDPADLLALKGPVGPTDALTGAPAAVEWPGKAVREVLPPTVEVVIEREEADARRIRVTRLS